MSIPSNCTVLVVGGGPGGSYAASVLSREGIDTVLLESEKMPRYHVGETTLPTIRHYLRFIDLESEFDKYGFTQAVGAAFRFQPPNPEGFTDFLLGGVGNTSWNMTRAESDELLFRHAGKSGAKIFDSVTVDSVKFAQPNESARFSSLPSPGRPVSASWSKREDGSIGVIKFDFIVDATGSAGLLNTKYLKNRHYNTGLNKSAEWAYFKGAGIYGEGTEHANVPLYEAIEDRSGWVWSIPLHDGIHSIGVVMDQNLASKRRAAAGSPQKNFNDVLKQAHMTAELLKDAKQVTDIKSTSGYSYYAGSYAFPNARIIGDAGCFTDIFFSSGIHLAMTHALSAATSIAASIRGDVDEPTAAQWHHNKIREGYSRFLLLALCAYKQIQPAEDAALSEFDAENFDRDFGVFQPITQGTADPGTGKITQDEFTETIIFLTKAFKVHFKQTEGLTNRDLDALQGFRHHQGSHIMNIQGFKTEVIDGLLPNVEKGNLTLVPAKAQ